MATCSLKSPFTSLKKVLIKWNFLTAQIETPFFLLQKFHWAFVLSVLVAGSGLAETPFIFRQMLQMNHNFAALYRTFALSYFICFRKMETQTPEV